MENYAFFKLLKYALKFFSIRLTFSAFNSTKTAVDNNIFFSHWLCFWWFTWLRFQTTRGRYSILCEPLFILMEMSYGVVRVIGRVWRVNREGVIPCSLVLV